MSIETIRSRVYGRTTAHANGSDGSTWCFLIVTVSFGSNISMPLTTEVRIPRISPCYLLFPVPWGSNVKGEVICLISVLPVGLSRLNPADIIPTTIRLDETDA